MRTKLFVLAFSVAASAWSEGAAQVSRNELYSFSSVTLTDAQFLMGQREGPQVSLAGQLRIPRPGTDKLPAVILVHGSGGIGGTGGPTEEWATELNKLGIATFTFDSFSGRGIVSTVLDQSQLGRLAMIVDIYRALELLAKHPRIDPARIAVMGFSRGGQAALYSSLKRFQKMHGPSGELTFAAYIAFYPTCNTTFRGDEELADKPVRILHGAADNYVPIGPCKTYVDRLLKAGRDVKLIEYPDAHHVFDAPVFRQPLVIAAAPTTRQCQMVEGAEGQIVNRETQRTFSYSDACVQKGVTVAFNETANGQARAYVREFFTERFALKK